MDPVGSETEGGDGGDGLLEDGALGAGLEGVGDLGRGEVGHQAGEAKLGTRCDEVEESAEVGADADALAGHAGVDLKVNGERGVCGRCGFAEMGELIEGRDDRGEAVADDGLGFVGEGGGGAHDEDVRLPGVGDAGFAEDRAGEAAFGGVGDSEPLRAGVGQDLRAGGDAVTVGVGFDDREEGGVAGLGGEDGADRGEVRCQPFFRDLRPNLHLHLFPGC